MVAIRQFRLIVDGNATVNRMIHDDELYRAATIDLLSTLAQIDDNGCAVIKELTKTQMALVEDSLKRELKVSKKELAATHLVKLIIDESVCVLCVGGWLGGYKTIVCVPISVCDFNVHVCVFREGRA